MNSINLKNTLNLVFSGRARTPFPSSFFYHDLYKYDAMARKARTRPSAKATAEAEIAADPTIVQPEAEEQVITVDMPKTAYPEEPLLEFEKPSQPPTNDTTNDTPAESQTAGDQDDGNSLKWSVEMVTALVATLHLVFTNGGGADNSFKSATFELTGVRVREQ